MKLQFKILLVLFASCQNINGDPLDEDFGYVDVRPGAHMFWVVYHTELPGDWSEHPLIMWLQGGPGGSGVGFGNFKELGPYDINGNLREGRWTKKANVLFVDNPVGTGYSYVDDLDLLCTDNAQVANDLLTFIKSVFVAYPDMQKMPFFVYAESYGGKFAADFAIVMDKAIKDGEIKSNFQGIAMGDSWISPIDSVNTWGSYLYSMGFVNKEGQAAIDNAAAKTQKAVDDERWSLATDEWSHTESVVLKETDGVDFYNILAPDSSVYSQTLRSSSRKYSFMRPEIRELYFRHVMPMTRQARKSLWSFMNGPQKEHWNIPDNVIWDSQGNYVFSYLEEDFMKPVIISVADLLNNSNIHVAVYTGDLDLICDTPGTYLWIDNMDYPQKAEFNSTEREALTVSNYPNNAAYVQRFERFSVFTLLRSGHMTPIDVPDMTLNMIDIITEYGAEAAGNENKFQAPKNKASVVHSKLEAKVTGVEKTGKKEVKKVPNQELHQESKKEHIEKLVEKHVTKASTRVKVKAYGKKG